MSRAQLGQWYSRLTPRDRRVLQIGGVSVAIILLAALLLLLQSRLGKAKDRLQTEQDDLAWMVRVAPTLAAAGSGAVTPSTPQSLVVLLEQSAQELGLGQTLIGAQPAGNGAMRVQLENADFNLLVGWTARLSSQHGVRVESASIVSSKSPGVVNATLQFRAR